ncbi:MAG: DNA polymerase III subunit beta [Bacteroidetes bacterium 4572_112]|nr:MAG: DNA polymerase III subunit beta [Bacteroidetes bacterium 4572_112]
MKFIASSKLLQQSLQSISGVLGTNSTLPILDNFLFRLENDELKVTASDVETTMTVSVSLVKSEDEGIIAIPAKILLDTLKTFGDIPITFNVNTETNQIELITDDGKFKMSGYDGNEYPSNSEMESPSEISISAEILEDAIGKTIFATGNDELRPVMMGVNFEFTANGLILVGTDAHKLVKYTKKSVVSKSEDSFVVPKKPLNQLKGILGKTNENVVVKYNKTNASFEFDNYSLVCRLVDSKYPNYEAVIPKDNPNTLIVDRLQLLNKIRRVSFFANQSTNQIRLSISGQELILSAEDLDFTNEAHERLNCSYDGSDLEIGFNSKFILEMLNNLSSEQVIMELSTPGRAGLLLPVVEDDSDEEILMLVMPIMLTDN